MRLFRVHVRLLPMRDGRAARGAEVEILVDTAATYTTVPAPILGRCGVSPLGTFTVRLADGSTVEKEHGAAILEVEGRKIGTTVLFGTGKDVAILGATTLEEAALAADRVGRRLVPVQAIQA